MKEKRSKNNVNSNNKQGMMTVRVEGGQGPLNGVAPNKADDATNPEAHNIRVNSRFGNEAASHIAIDP